MSASTVDAIALARDLLRCPSVTPAEGGALALIENVLKTAGFEVHRVTFSEPGTAPVDNLYASPVLVEYFRQRSYEDLVIVSPDAGGVERARACKART